MSVPVTGGKGKGKEEEPALSYHAVAYVDLAPLLYPGGRYTCIQAMLVTTCTCWKCLSRHWMRYPWLIDLGLGYTHV